MMRGRDGRLSALDRYRHGCDRSATHCRLRRSGAAVTGNHTRHEDQGTGWIGARGTPLCDFCPGATRSARTRRATFRTAGRRLRRRCAQPAVHTDHVARSGRTGARRCAAADTRFEGSVSPAKPASRGRGSAGWDRRGASAGTCRIPTDPVASSSAVSPGRRRWLRTAERRIRRRPAVSA